jgi:hypothetical protein
VPVLGSNENKPIPDLDIRSILCKVTTVHNSFPRPTKTRRRERASSHMNRSLTCISFNGLTTRSNFIQAERAPYRLGSGEPSRWAALRVPTLAGC